MFFISENKTLKNIQDRDSINHQLYTLNMEIEDYFLQFSPLWDEITSDVYHFALEKGRVMKIPSGFYVMVADIYGSLDWILIDEAIGREIDALIIGVDFRGWSLQPLKLVSHSVESFYWPVTRNAVPIAATSVGENTIILSKSDQYRYTKDKSVEMVVV